MSLLSPLPGSSAPAYCDIVPLFSQSIAFNRTGAHWPNWKGLQPAFHQSHSRAGCRVFGVQRGMAEVCGVSFSVAPLSLLLSFLLHLFLLQCFMPSDGCGNILGEMSIVFHQSIHCISNAGVPIDGGEEWGINSSLKEKCLYFPFVCLMRLRHVMKVCLLFSSLHLQFFFWKTGFERTHLPNEKFLCVL